MSEDDASFLSPKSQPQAGRLGIRTPRTYAGMQAVQHSSDKPVEQVSDKCKTKSYAQVATLVRPRVVRPKSCGLKPGRKRPYRLMGRFSREERDRVVSKAAAAELSVNEFIRQSALETDYAAALNPALRQLFRNVHRELCRQGDDLSRIAEQMETNLLSPNERNTLLGMIGWSLMATHRAVTEALVQGLEMPD